MGVNKIGSCLTFNFIIFAKNPKIQMIRSLRIPYHQIQQLSEKDRAYIGSDSRLMKFQKYKASIHSFQDIINDKEQQKIDRVLLVEVLKKQYQDIQTNYKVLDQIELLLNQNTFTVSTAHQPSLFTGPLYFIYKIISTINLAESLKSFYPSYNFVPMFISGAEDHDFDEINHFHLFGKKITWESSQGGSVGLMKNTGLNEVIDQLGDLIQNDEIIGLLNEFYPETGIYGKSALRLVDFLFSKYGLVVLDMNKKELKNSFKSYFEKEVFERPSEKLVKETQDELAELGFSPQAFVRPINLFYLQEGSRNRIERNIEGFFEILNTDIKFSEEEMRNEIQNYPEKFSPNVVLRPIYQEFILPNLAYVGGGGEIAYWLERKTQFEYFNVNFPVLIRRNSALLIDEASNQRLEKLGYHAGDLFKDIEILTKEYLDRNSQISLDLKDEIEKVSHLFDSIARKAIHADKTLEKTVLAEKSKQIKSLEYLEEKIIKAEKQKHDIALQQIQKLKIKNFPENGLQERFENFLPYYLKMGDQFFETLKENLNPFEEGFVVLIGI